MKRWSRDDEIELKNELPKCKSKDCKKNILVPMRYVAACSNGHMNDVNWYHWAHSKSKESEGRCSPMDPELSF